MATRIIVTGCAGSGMRWIVKVLNHLGITAQHEHVYRTDHQPPRPWLEGQEAEVSWCAAPHLENLAPDVAVFHQVRHPLRVLMCWCCYRLARNDISSGIYAHRYLPECTQGTDEERAIQYILKWNQMIANARNSNPYVRYGIEHLTAEDLQEMLLLAGHPINISLVQEAMNLPKVGSCNHTQEELSRYTWQSLAHLPGIAELKDQAAYYGYTL